MIFPEEAVFARYPFASRGAIVDVGANVGAFFAPFAHRGWQVVAFEPHPDLFARLSETYGTLPNVRCIQCAISDQVGQHPFYTSDEHPGIHSLAAFHSTHKPTVEVSVGTLRRELLRLNVLDVTALKIDIEGADLLALKGFDFNTYRPELVMVEFMDSRSEEHFGYTHHDMVDLMREHGYGAWVSEWSDDVQYGRVGRPPTHRWRGFHAYRANGTPAHGNLIFANPTDVGRLKIAVGKTFLIASALETARSIPGSRSAVRIVRRLLRP